MNGIYLRKYGVAATIDFHTFEVDGVDLRKDAAPGTADLFVMKDEGAEAAATNAATDEGRGYSLVLTATEMTAARITVYVEDQTGTKVWLDTVLIIETYGNASAQHAFDLDTASTAQTGDSFARLGAPAGASVSADLLVIDTNVDDIETDTNELQGDWTNGGRLDLLIDAILLDTGELQTDWVNGGRLDLLLDAVQTDLDNSTDGLGALKALIDTLDDFVDTEIQAIKDETALIVADTNELQGDWTNGGRLDLLLDAIPTTAMRGTDSAALASVCTEVRLATLTDWINGGRLDLLLDAIPTTAMRGTDSAALASEVDHCWMGYISW